MRAVLSKAPVLESQSITQAVVNLAAIEKNLRAMWAKVGKHRDICPTLKADACGHGAVQVARRCLSCGVRTLAVATKAEALEMREALPECRVLLFGGLLETDLADLLGARIEVTLSNQQQLGWILRTARRLHTRPIVHVNVDTGMGRVGVIEDESIPFILEVGRTRELELGSVYTHFPSSDEADRSFARRQIQGFKRIISRARALGVVIPSVHAANSGAILDLPESYFDMVRVGITLYGLYPSREASRSVDITPAMRVTSRLVLVRDIPHGWTVSYGRTSTAQRRTRLGVVPMGYADGLSRRLSNAGQMIVKGRTVPIVGRVCMDMTMLDLTDASEARVGDEVTVYSDRREDPNSVEAIAQLIGTIPHEVVCTLTKRVTRVYVNEMDSPGK